MDKNISQCEEHKYWHGLANTACPYCQIERLSATPDLTELRALVERMRKLPKKRISQGLAIDPAPDVLIMHRHLAPLLNELEALIGRIDGHPRSIGDGDEA